MACAHNFRIKDKNYSNINYKVPCRRCINCRVDRRKMWKERCEYEFKKLISGSFVTFTYNDIFLYTNCIKKGNDGKLRASLNYKDVSNFIDRLRKYIENHKETQSILRNPKFKYLGVGEYGENGAIFNRPHYHVLFFGLDFKFNKKLFEQEWGYGFIDSLPILKGGINYVLKYMDKQIMGKENIFDNYTRHFLEKPKQFQSKGLGAELYYKNYENIKKNNGTIKSGMKKIQVPPYYKNKMNIHTDKREITEKQVENLKNYYKNKKFQSPNREILYNKATEIEEHIEREYQNLLLKQEENYRQSALNHGEKIFIGRI